MSRVSLLPTGFETLEPYVEGWAIEGSQNRLQRRLDSEELEREAFYNAAKDMVPAALDYLDTKKLDQFDERDNRLMNLMLSMAHVLLAVEIQRDQEDFHAKYARFITITRASADDNPATI